MQNAKAKMSALTLNQLFLLLAASTPQGALSSHYAEAVKVSLVKRGLLRLSVQKSPFKDGNGRNRMVSVYFITEAGAGVLAEHKKKEAA